MSGSRTVVLALLVCFGAFGGVALATTQQSSSMTVQPVDNASNYLAPDAGDVERGGQETTSLDVAASVSANAAGVRSTFSTVSFRRTYDDADTDADRRAVVRNGTERLAGRVDALERREQRAIEAYARGETSREDLFRTLAAIDAEAEARSSTAAELRDRAADLGMGAEAERLSALRIRLVPLQGPVRAEITEGLNGERTRVHAEAAGGGLVLATVQEDEDGNPVYLREAYDPGIRSVGPDDRYEGDVGAVFDRLGEIYPWVNGGDIGVADANFISADAARLYSITYEHDHGRLTPYLDGGSNRVVRETQRLRVATLPTESRNLTADPNSGSETLRVRVETTYPGGPLGVTAFDAATGERVDARVAVDGTVVGSTDGERLWTVAPRGRANVTVVDDDERVSVEIAG
ncbi:hypothetical protein BRC88_05580 [Halobacteriales archaeon QS_4_69_225]|nr:MAG: hypothetical protein BRC88_05580 [Halobacteriales archaeon QS_4_69_225]